MNMHKNKIHIMILIITLIGGLTPLALYWFIYGQTAIITPPETKTLLLAENSQAVLVDIRLTDKFNMAHIDGAQHWPLEEILLINSQSQIPEHLCNKTLLLICDSGIASNTATKHLANMGFEKAMSVRGGLQEWIGSVTKQEGGEFDRCKSVSGQISTFPIRTSPLYEQILAIISGFGIKVIYTLLSLFIIIMLWRSKSPDLIALRWAMIFFFVGENSCAINYIVFTEKSYIFEYLHSYGMLLSFGFATYAIIEGIDRRILMLSEPNKKCAALSLCKKCIKYEKVPCGLKRTFLMIIPASILIAFMPLCSGWHNNSYNTMIAGTFYNYAHRVIYQQYENIYCPIAAIILLAISLLVLLLKKNDSLHLSKIWFAAGIGPLGFGMLRSILAGMYSQNMVWLNFWEELTELLFIVGVCFILWVFRQSLFKAVDAEE